MTSSMWVLDNNNNNTLFILSHLHIISTMWIFSIGISKCQILRKNQTGVGVLDNNTTNTNTYFNYIRMYSYTIYTTPCFLVRKLWSLSATRQKTPKSSDSSSVCDAPPNFLQNLRFFSLPFCWFKWEKKNQKTNVGDTIMVLKFFFWFESSIRAEQSKSLLCVWSLELPHCGCGLGDFNSRTLLLLLRGGLDLLSGFFFLSYLPLKLELQLDPTVFMLV